MEERLFLKLLIRFINNMDINPTKKITFYNSTKYRTVQLIPDEDICARFVFVFLTVCSVEIKPACQS